MTGSLGNEICVVLTPGQYFIIFLYMHMFFITAEHRRSVHLSHLHAYQTAYSTRYFPRVLLPVFIRWEAGVHETPAWNDAISR